MTTEKRTVVVYERLGVPPKLQPSYRGTFHGFSMSYEEFDNGAAPLPIALVEREDGQMESVFVGHVKFEIPTPLPAAPETA